jgi:hypothetical protein
MSSSGIDTLNLTGLSYVGFRLAPFILVSYFVISSILSSDLKGIVFLAFLLLNCFVTMILGNALPEDPASRLASSKGICQTLTLTQNGPLSKNLPLNINIFGYTFAYLATIMVIYKKDKIAERNIPTIMVFSALIVYQFIWTVFIGECNGALYTLISFGVGAGLGVLSSWAIDRAKIFQLQYFNGLSNKEVCKRSSNQKFKCTKAAA